MLKKMSELLCRFRHRATALFARYPLQATGICALECKLLKCEYRKLKRSEFLVIVALGAQIVPFFVLVNAIVRYIADTQNTVSLFSLYDNALMFLMLLFAPILLTILGAWIISREYTDGTLKNILAIPVSKTAFFVGKLLFFGILTFLFLLLSWLEIWLLALVCSCFLPVENLTVSTVLFFGWKLLEGGILLCMTQTPFLYLTVRTKGFVAPLVAMAGISLANVVLSNSPIAGFYPWSASYLLLRRQTAGYGCPKEVSLGILFAVCLLGIIASLVRIHKED